MAKHDYYDIKNIKRRRRIKKTLLAIGTGAVIVAGVKHFNPDLKLPKFPTSNTETPVNEDNNNLEDIVIYDEPVIDPGIEYEDTIDEETEDSVYEDTNATIVEHNIENRVITLMNAYTYYDSALENALPSEQELANLIDFMNGDYEVTNKAEAEAMYKKLFDYYVILLNSSPYAKRVNEHTETLQDYQFEGDENNFTETYTFVKPTESTYSGNAFNCNLTDVILTNKNISIYPLLSRLDGLHKIILSSNYVEIRDAAIMELDQILTDIYYGGVEIEGIYYTTDILLNENNTAAACLFEQYLYDLLPFLANVSGTHYDTYGNYFTSEEYLNTWENSLVNANMDGQYSYTLK